MSMQVRGQEMLGVWINLGKLESKAKFEITAEIVLFSECDDPVPGKAGGHFSPWTSLPPHEEPNHGAWLNCDS